MSDFPESTSEPPAENVLASLGPNDKVILRILAQIHKLQQESRLQAEENQAGMQKEFRELRAELRDVRAELFDLYRLVAPLKPLVVCSGMIRSGSTLQYQVLADLIEQRGLGQRVGFVDKKTFREVRSPFAGVSGLSVVKIHDFLPEIEPWLKLEESRIFYTYRDLRSVAVSVMRIWKIPFADLVCPKGWLDNAVAADARWRACPQILVSRYEDLMNSLPREIGRWATALGLDLTPQQLEEMSARYSIPAQQERIRQARLPEEGPMASALENYDAESLLHGRHIADGSVGGWMKVLDPAQVKQIEDRYSGWLRENGFALATAG